MIFQPQGYGRGYDTLLLAEHGYDTVGVDISAAAIVDAKAWVGLFSRKSLILSVPYCPQSKLSYKGTDSPITSSLD